MPEPEDVEIQARLSLATDRRELNVYLETLEPMSAVEWANILRGIADQIEAQGDAIYDDCDDANLHN